MDANAHCYAAILTPHGQEQREEDNRFWNDGHMDCLFKMGYEKWHKGDMCTCIPEERKDSKIHGSIMFCTKDRRSRSG
jgi:hypothetical protein